LDRAEAARLALAKGLTITGQDIYSLVHLYNECSGFDERRVSVLALTDSQ
jgi:hypothetical protein